MNTNRTNIRMQYKNIILIALAVALILLVPWLAMQITDEVAWSTADFAFAGALLFGTGFAYELIARKLKSTLYRVALGSALVTALLLVWSNLAVGIIGTEDNPINLMYFGVLAVALIGALSAHFRPDGVARALYAAALAQAFVAAIALIAEHFQDGFEILLVNGFFVALWVGSALLFRRAKASLPDRQLEE